MVYPQGIDHFAGAATQIRNRSFAFSFIQIKPHPIRKALHFCLAAKSAPVRIDTNYSRTRKTIHKGMVFLSGAATQIRTGDLILTKDVLYQLSHSSNCENYYSKIIDNCQPFFEKIIKETKFFLMMPKPLT